jgi:uncharacterized protein
VRILITGATGFIGSALVPQLQRDRHAVLVWTRSETRARERLGAEIEPVPVAGGLSALTHALDGCDAIVNLAGESIMGGRWTRARRELLRQSRIGTTDLIVRALSAAQPRRRVFVSGSAVGYYGDRGDVLLTEASTPGTGFLAQLCQDWEAAAIAARRLDARVVTPRIGIVLGRNGGALSPMAIPFKLGLGGRLGSGRQYMPWIHRHDLVSVLCRALTDEALDGPVNCVAPETVTNGEFTRVLGRALRRPAVMVVPAFAIRAALGEAAGALLESQRVSPAVLMSREFPFAFPSLAAALAEVFQHFRDS